MKTYKAIKINATGSTKAKFDEGNDTVVEIEVGEILKIGKGEGQISAKLAGKLLEDRLASPYFEDDKGEVTNADEFGKNEPEDVGGEGLATDLTESDVEHATGEDKEHEISGAVPDSNAAASVEDKE